MTEIAIGVRGLTKRYGYFYGVRDVSFQVPEGEIFGILGPNGAGKTTLLKLIATIMRPTEGDVHVHGTDARRDPFVVKRMVGFLSHYSLLYEEFTGRENLHFFAKLYGLSGREREKRIESLTDLFGITEWLDEPVYVLSRGLKKRFDLARTFIHNPKVLLLDEPFTELDVKSYDVLKKFLKETSNHTVVISSTDVRWIKKICAKAAIIEGGRLQKITESRELGAD